MLAFLAPLAMKIGGLLLGFAEKRADAELERYRINAGIDEAEIKAKVELGAQAASVVKAGMQFKWFWIPWLIATVPLSMWFGWGMLDSLVLDGAVLPDVAELPPQLKAYADTAWSNLFYSGGAVAGAQLVARAIQRR